VHRLVRRAPSRLPECSLFTFKDKEKFLISPDLLALTADAADLQGETSGSRTNTLPQWEEESCCQSHRQAASIA
jgi:hypothetical protein